MNSVKDDGWILDEYQLALRSGRDPLEYQTDIKEDSSTQGQILLELKKIRKLLEEKL